MKKLSSAFALLALVSTLHANYDAVVVFNEIMYHPETDEPNREWIELHNQHAVNVDLSGWSITGGIDYTFPDGTVIPGRGFVVVGINPGFQQIDLGINPIFGPFVGRLANGGETIRLRDNNRRIRDELNYGVRNNWPAAPDGNGFSLAKLDRDTGSADPRHWVSSEAKGGTPGADNFPFIGVEQPDTVVLDGSEAWSFDNTTTDLGTAWRDPAFDDSGWPTRTNVQEKQVTGLFSTGIGDNGLPIPNGQSDPHWTITRAAQGPTGINAIVIENHPAWFANNEDSKWIGIQNPGTSNVNPGDYWYATTFDTTGFILNSINITLQLGIDDNGPEVRLNGALTGISHDGFDALSGPITLTTPLAAGLNTLEIRSINGGAGANPHGIRAQIVSSGLAASTSNPLPPGATTYYFRQDFTFSGDPDFTQLKINPLIADGAVIYLNGQEVYRENMPAGPVDFSTPALSDVPNPVFSGIIPIASDNLIVGNNVLAVELHQAAGSPDDPLFGLELSFESLSQPDLLVNFNEQSPGTNNTFWVEIANYNPTNTVDLQGYQILWDSPVTNETYTFPAGASIAANGFLSVNESELGFLPQAGDKLVLLRPGGLNSVDSIQVRSRPRGRFPDGDGRWLFTDPGTPGAANQFPFRDEIVINEIMYHARIIPPTDTEPARESPEGWIELYNRSANTVDLTGWELTGGIDYHFAPGETMAPGEYLVIAEDAAFLQAFYPGIRILGDLNGRLSHSSDDITLEDDFGNPADEVTYHDYGPWDSYADGGGASLELKDPDADNSKAEAWQASDESAGGVWENITYRKIAQNVASSPSQWRDFIFGLMGGGEILIDDISAIEDPDGQAIQLVGNGNFSSGLDGWRLPGNHKRSRVIQDPDNPGNPVLHVVATGTQEHMHNHIESTHLNNRTVSNGRLVEISFRAKWVAGNNLVNTRIYFNRSAQTTRLTVPARGGTPGAQNSRYEPNVGPTYSGLGHSPVIPDPGEPVTVTVKAEDPEGVASMRLWFSANGASFGFTGMTHRGRGVYTGTIPGLTAGNTVQFYVQGTDTLGASSTFPARGPDSGALFKVADGQDRLNLSHNVRIILSPANTTLLHQSTNVQSNEKLPGTVIYDESRAHYDVGVRLKGSQRGRDVSVRVSFHLTFPPDDLFRDVHPVMLVDRSGAGGSTNDKQKEILIRHMLMKAGGIDGAHPDLCWVIAPQSQHTESAILIPRLEDNYVQGAFANGGDGEMFELELIYYPTSAEANGYKRPQPDAVVGQDITNLGDDKEPYRYNFIKKDGRIADEYRNFMRLAKVWALSNELLDDYAPQVMDINKWTRAWAFKTLCGVGDSYTFGNNHNLLMYRRPSDGRFLPFLWDMDFSFNRGTTSALIGDQNLSRIIRRTPNLRLFYGHMKEIIGTTYNNAYMDTWITHYDDFAPGQDYGDVIGYISSRSSYALGQINSAGGNAAFNVTSASAVTTSDNLVTITGNAPVDAATIRINGRTYPITWNNLNTWSMTVPVTDANTTLTLVGYDVHGQPLTNLTETVTVDYTGPAVPDPTGVVVFNELMYNPPVFDGEYVEFLNTSPNIAFDLSGWRVNGLDYTFPQGAIIAPGQELVLAKSLPAFFEAYGTNTPPPFDTFDGSLDNNGETLTLFIPGTDPDPDIEVDKVRYENVAPWATTPDGTGSSLQLIDGTVDNSRVSNWGDGQGWRFFKRTGTLGFGAIGVRLSLASPGNIFIDNLRLEIASQPGEGVNLALNGDLETGDLTGWSANGNHATSRVVSDTVHSGSFALEIIATGSGSTFDLVVYSIAGLNTTDTYTLSFNYLSPGSNRLKYHAGSAMNEFNFGFDVTPTLNTPGVLNTTSGVLPPYDPVWLNEAAPNNVSGLTDGQGDTDPWIELYNSGPSPVSLDGYYLANNYGANLTQWQFPAGTTIDPGEFKVVWVDGEPGETAGDEIHASFSLTPGTGSLALVRLNGGAPQITDYLSYAGLTDDETYGDFPDGQPFKRIVLSVPTPGAANIGKAADIFINEWLASNVASLADPADGNREDWFELFNAGSEAVDLTGFFLTDNLNNKTRFEIPPGFIIDPGAFLLVWADNDPEQNIPGATQLHVNFALDQLGESIGLYSPQGIAVDEISFGFQTNDVSQGRFPDGSATIEAMFVTTPGGPNTLGGGNVPPNIQAINDVTLFLGQSLTVPVNVIDPDVPPQFLIYNLTGAPAGMNIFGTGATTAEISWTPAENQAPGTNTVTVTVTDSGVPSLSDNEVFTVTVLVPPSVGISLSPGQVSLTFDTIPGKTYRVEHADTLNPPINWQPLGPDQVAAGTSITIDDVIGGNPQRFYRVIQLD